MGTNMTPAAKKKLFLILDGNALLHRAWHALPPLMTRDGRVVNAAYGFAMIVEKMLDTIRPDYMAVAWDLPGETFRHKKYKAYKATREKKEQELYDQIPIIQDMLSRYGIQSLSAEGFEADDLLGTLSKKAAAKKLDSLILTGDLDSLQLIDESTKVLFFQKGISETKTYDVAAVKERYGLTPEQLIDYKAFRGDPSDNIPGVPGIGEKTATELIQSFGGVKDIFRAVKQKKVPEKYAKKLEGHEQTALDTRELVEIVRNVPITFALSSFKVSKPDPTKLLELFRDLEFKSLIRKYAGEAPMPEPAKKKMKREARSAVVRDPEHLREQLRMLKDAPIVSLLVREKTRDLFGGSLAFAAVSNGTTTVVVPEPSKEQIEELCGFLHDTPTLVTHDLKRLLHLLARFECAVDLAEHSGWHDLHLAGYLLGSGTREHDLPSLAREHLDMTLAELPATGLSEEQHQIAGQTSASLIPLFEKLKTALERDGLWKLYAEIEMPLLPILFRMERTGIKLDAELLKKISKDFEKSLASLTKKIYKEAGVEFNVNSPSQLAQVLFEQLKLPTKGVKRTKQGFSTAAPELEKLHDAHPVVPLIGEYREIAKLKSTYVDALPSLVADDGRIHTTFHQTVAATGRLSSADPNLQNIPIKTELGNKIRMAFVADKGKKLIAADYSQIELRLAAVIAKDQAFINAFRDGADIHTRTAAEVWGVAEAEVTPEQRRAAKAINFGILYGMGPRSLARSTGLSFDEAKDFIDRYFQIHHAIKTYIDETKLQAHEQGFVSTLFGRRRYFPEINSGVQMLVAAAERMAINMPVQGTAADVMKMAMIQVDGWLRTAAREKVRMLLQVHDELVFEVDATFVDEAARAVKQFMETTVSLEVPLVVDVEVGNNWGEMAHWGGEHEA
jgi:DNA polymerase-1